MEDALTADLLERWALLGAVAAWTSRVRIVTTVVVPQLHEPVLLATSLATADLLSGGRLTVGVGVGGREEDYHAVGAPVSDAVGPVGPPPVQPGGPPVLVGTMGPRTIRRSSTWPDRLGGPGDPTSRRRSSSPSGLSTRRGHRSTGTCVDT